MVIDKVAKSNEPVTLAQKVRFLSEVQSYPQRPSSVESRETHMSWVFLTDEYVYKLKKPVKYDHLDYSTLETRFQNCQNEFHLNQRLAGDIYLDVVALRCDNDGRLNLEDIGTVVDWLVLMKRIPDECMLDHLISQHRLNFDEIDRAAEKLTKFYIHQSPIFPDYKQYINDLDERHSEIAERLYHPLFGLDPKVIRKLKALLWTFLQENAALIKHRIDSGCVVEGHGDLRPEHICIRPTPQFIDCIEFYRPFRVLDVADELAFLYLECDRLSEAEVGERFIKQYIQGSGDHIPELILRFYKSHTAFIRSYLAIRHLLEEDYQDSKWKKLADYYLTYAIWELEHT